MEVHAPPLLLRHLTVVHAVAVELLNGLAADFPGLVVNREAVVFGSSVHDIGKTLHRHELTGPGDQHEVDGPALLIKHGVSPRLARFARTHGRWYEVDDLEDLLVALADNIWCGRRVEELEAKLTLILATRTGLERWAAWSRLAAICEEIASKGEERLAYCYAVIRN